MSLRLAACALALTGCGGEDKKLDDTADPAEAESCDVVVSDADCDTSLRPIVFVHGTFGSGDNIAHVASLFGSNGYCPDRFVALEYNSVNLGGPSPIAELDALIEEARTATGQDQVELMGHSQGTRHCINYLSDPTRAAKVAHYVNLSGNTALPAGVKALSLSSNNDLGGTTHHAEGAEKIVTFEDEDHVDVASSDAAFLEIYRYLIGKEPQYTEIQCGDEDVTLQGIAETFGDNEPVTGGQIEIYELGDSPQERGEPMAVITSDERGHTAPFTLKRLTQYEFRALDASGALVGHMYFAPFKRSNRLVRFLAPSENPIVAVLSTDQVVSGPTHSALVARYARGSFRHDLGRTLKVNGQEVLTDDNAGRTMTTVGLFMSDQNQNGTTDLGAAFSAPFVVGTDVFVSTAEPAWVTIESNGTVLKIPNWPSSEGFISLMMP